MPTIEEEKDTSSSKAGQAKVNMDKPHRSNRFSRAFVSKIATPFRRLVSSNPRAESHTGSSAAVVSGEWVFVSAVNGCVALRSSQVMN